MREKKKKNSTTKTMRPISKLVYFFLLLVAIEWRPTRLFARAFLPIQQRWRPLTVHRRTSTSPSVLRGSLENDQENEEESALKTNTEEAKPTKTNTVPKPTSSALRRAAANKPKNFRMQLFQILNSPIVEIMAASAVLLSSLLVALNTLTDLPAEAYTAIENTLLIMNVIFFFDFFIRWYAAGNFKPIYLTKPLAVIDIVVVILPLALGSSMLLLDQLGSFGEEGKSIMSLSQQGYSDQISGFSADLFSAGPLQNLLLLRVLRLRRVLTDITTFSRFQKALGLTKNTIDVKPYQLELARVLLSIFTLLSVASGLIYTAEHNVNPDIPDYFTALYFGLTTLTTVGYGDISPVTAQGRLVVCGSILAGVAIIPAQAAKLVDVFIESQNTPRSSGTTPATTGRSSGSVSVRRQSRKRRVVDGKGPSGMPLEMPPIDEVILSSIGEEVEVSTETLCGHCGATHHRADAKYCWSCGADELFCPFL